MAATQEEIDLLYKKGLKALEEVYNEHVNYILAKLDHQLEVELFRSLVLPDGRVDRLRAMMAEVELSAIAVHAAYTEQLQALRGLCISLGDGYEKQ